MGIFDFAKHKPTLDEKQEELDKTTLDRQIWENKAAIAEYRRRGGDINAVKEGGRINISKVWQWLRTH